MILRHVASRPPTDRKVAKLGEIRNLDRGIALRVRFAGKVSRCRSLLRKVLASTGTPAKGKPDSASTASIRIVTLAPARLCSPDCRSACRLSLAPEPLCLWSSSHSILPRCPIRSKHRDEDAATRGNCPLLEMSAMGSESRVPTPLVCQTTKRSWAGRSRIDVVPEHPSCRPSGDSAPAANSFPESHSDFSATAFVFASRTSTSIVAAGAKTKSIDTG